MYEQIFRALKGRTEIILSAPCGAEESSLFTYPRRYTSGYLLSAPPAHRKGIFKQLP
jgi:hypothetical protein